MLIHSKNAALLSKKGLTCCISQSPLFCQVNARKIVFECRVPFNAHAASVCTHSFNQRRYLSFEYTQSYKRVDRYNPNLFVHINPELKKPTVTLPNPEKTLKGSLEPLPSQPQPNKPSLWHRVKTEVIHYYHGFRLLGLEVKIASGMCFRVMLGKTLTRRERKQLVRTVADIIRLLPFAVFLIVPFMELLLPVYLKFFPFMLPSTFKQKGSESEKVRQRLKAKLEMTRFLQETLTQTSGSTPGKDLSPTIAEFRSFLKEAQESGEPAQTEDIIRFSKLFEDQVTLDSLDIKQLKMICQILSLPIIGPSHLLRFQIYMRVRQLKAEDMLIAKEGIDQIPTWELQSLCQERGMRSVGLTNERLKAQLSQWLTLNLEKNVPISLLLFSQALYVTRAAIDELPLVTAIAKLSPSASEEATVRMLETAPPSDVDLPTKIEVLRKEQANIKADRARKKQELAEQAKEENAKASAKTELEEKEKLTDKAPVLSGLQDEALESVPTEVEPARKVTASSEIEKPIVEPSIASVDASLPASVAFSDAKLPLSDAPASGDSVAREPTIEKDPEEVDTEITAVDLAEIESAIAESSDALQAAALHGFKEEVAETAKAQQRQALAVTSDKAVDKKTKKAAARLESRVTRMISEMDSMMDKLLDERKELLKDIDLREVHVKEATNSDLMSEMLDTIKAQHNRVVDINDLLLALRRIQKAPDEARWQKILAVLDEDHDGKIELEHVLSVIELLGSENVRLSTKEVTRVLEMIDNENLAHIIESSEPEDMSKKADSTDSTEPELPVTARPEISPSSSQGNTTSKVK